MKELTVFTPTYNRAHTLPRVYKSLLRQTCKDFEWLIIDDGSSDNTKALVDNWISEGSLTIRYVYQENQGMHGAHNTAYDNISTPLCVCIDSDDFMPDDAVEKIITFWKEKGSDKFAGFIGLDCTLDGNIIGKPFPEGLVSTTFRGLIEKYHLGGDKKYVYRTEVIKAYPKYPIFGNEKYFSLAYLYDLIGDKYEMLLTNDILCIVEYQDDGSSRGMWKQYWNNPRGFAFMRKTDMQRTTRFKRKLESCIQYVNHSIRNRNGRFLKETPLKTLTLLSVIPGFLLFLVNWYKVKFNILHK